MLVGLISAIMGLVIAVSPYTHSKIKSLWVANEWSVDQQDLRQKATVGEMFLGFIFVIVGSIAILMGIGTLIGLWDA